MNCSYCQEDLTELETHDNIYAWHTCPNCGCSIWLDYDETWDECEVFFEWIKINKFEL